MKTCRFLAARIWKYKMTRYLNTIHALPFHIHNFQKQPMVVQACLGSSYIFSTQSSMITRKIFDYQQTGLSLSISLHSHLSPRFSIFFYPAKAYYATPFHWYSLSAMASLSPFDSSIPLSRSFFSASCFVGLSVSVSLSYRHRHCVGPCARITGLSCDLPELGTQEGAEIV